MTYPVTLVENSPIIVVRYDSAIDPASDIEVPGDAFGEFDSTGGAEQCFACVYLAGAADDGTASLGGRFEESDVLADGDTWTTVEGTEIPAANEIDGQYEIFIIGLKAEKLTKKYFRMVLSPTLLTGAGTGMDAVTFIVGGSPNHGPVITAGALASGTTYKSSIRYVIK